MRLSCTNNLFSFPGETVWLVGSAAPWKFCWWCYGMRQNSLLVKPAYCKGDVLQIYCSRYYGISHLRLDPLKTSTCESLVHLYFSSVNYCTVCWYSIEFYIADRQVFSKGMAHDEAVAAQKTGKSGSPPKVRIADLQVPADHWDIAFKDRKLWFNRTCWLLRNCPTSMAWSFWKLVVWFIEIHCQNKYLCIQFKNFCKCSKEHHWYYWPSKINMQCP